jgi:hypothetical protein
VRVRAHVRATSHLPNQANSTPRLIQLRLLARADHSAWPCSTRRSRPRLVALPVFESSQHPRLSLPTSQLTASDLRVGPHPPTRNRTQQQSSKRASNSLPHHTALLSQADQLVTPNVALDLPCLFRPPGLCISLINTLHCLLFCLPCLHNTF